MTHEAEQLIRSHCSWCFVRAEHRRVGRNKLGRSVYACGKCGRRTVVCCTPTCWEMARGEGLVDDVFCAAHAGEIAGFGRLSMKIRTIEDYPSSSSVRSGIWGGLLKSPVSQQLGAWSSGQRLLLRRQPLVEQSELPFSVLAEPLPPARAWRPSAWEPSAVAVWAWRVGLPSSLP